MIRVIVPKLFMAWILIEASYYYWKYEARVSFTLIFEEVNESYTPDKDLLHLTHYFSKMYFRAGKHCEEMKKAIPANVSGMTRYIS